MVAPPASKGTTTTIVYPSDAYNQGSRDGEAGCERWTVKAICVAREQAQERSSGARW
ncbi:DUF4981 domain-containing protein [Sesbania bispinosa]|nr:DUF4981 domain-containing protein [Sesbania bispinosa]